MRNSPSGLKVPFLILWALILSAFTAVLSGAPLKVLRTLVGPVLFWIMGIVLVGAAWMTGIYPMAFILGAQTLLVGAFTEFDERDFSLRQAASLSICLTALVAASSFYLWVAFYGKGWLGLITNWVTAVLQKAATLNLIAVEGIKAEALVGQLPSAVLIFLVMSLAFALILERAVAGWTGVAIKRRERLSDFSVFEAMIWVFIVALLGSFAHLNSKTVETVALNAFNVCVAAYFFQGLAILAKYFEVFRVGALWRALWIFLLVIQLPIVLSLVGIVDLWVNFRRFFTRRAADLKKRRIEE